MTATAGGWTTQTEACRRRTRPAHYQRRPRDRCCCIETETTPRSPSCATATASVRKRATRTWVRAGTRPGSDGRGAGVRGRAMCVTSRPPGLAGENRG